jgi:hypothetical protein
MVGQAMTVSVCKIEEVAPRGSVTHSASAKIEPEKIVVVLLFRNIV